MSTSLNRSLRALRVSAPASVLPRAAARRPIATNSTEVDGPEASSSSSSIEKEDASSSLSTPNEDSISSSSTTSTSTSTSRSRLTSSSSSKPDHALVLSHYPVPRAPGSPFSRSPTGQPSPSHVHINFPTRAFAPPSKDAFPERLGGNASAEQEKILVAATGLSAAEIRGLRRFNVRVGRVMNMTKKGKMASFTALTVVGSPSRGLVGIGYGRGSTFVKSMDQGFHKAVLAMDYVNRYENRTLWGSGADLEQKWGAVKVIIRARPPGFGLMVPPMLHRVFTACGIRDASATIEGSRNEVEVVKCVVQMLHGGANPPGFGSGLAGNGRREDKGMGMRSKEEIERERGRFGVDIGRRM